MQVIKESRTSTLGPTLAVVMMTADIGYRGHGGALAGQALQLRVRIVPLQVRTSQLLILTLPPRIIT